MSLAVLLMLIGYQCQEAYTIDDLDKNQKIPVLNGLLTNRPQLNSFKLYYASPFGTTANTPITGATITILEDSSAIFTLTEGQKGFYYIPDEAPQLKFQHYYSVLIELPDGQLLYSDAQQLPDTIALKEVNFTKGYVTSIIKNGLGDYVEQSQYGLSTYARISQPTTDTYTRGFSIFYVHQQDRTAGYIYDTINFSDSSIIYRIYTDTLFDTIVAWPNAEFPETKEYLSSTIYTSDELSINTLFLEADINAKDFSYYAKTNFKSWIIPVDVYSTTNSTYDYYIDATQQLETEFQIYDPVPDQVVGNLHNSTNPNNVVLGFFDVSAVSRRYLKIYYSTGIGGSEYLSTILYDTIIQSGTSITTSWDTVGYEVIYK